MWPDDLKLREAAMTLYGAVWPHVPPGIDQAAAWGGDWFEVSTPFLVHSEGRLVAHVGVIVCRFALARPLRIAAVHGVCVHPEHRGRGHCREAMEAALAHIDESGFETTILWTEKVDLYRRFGFETRAESVFEGFTPTPEPSRCARLSLDSAEHIHLLRDTLRSRRPVSEIVAAADDGWHFLIDLGLWTRVEELLVLHMPDHDAILIGDLEDDTFLLYDLVARELPSLAAITGGVGEATGTPIRRIRAFFTPDALVGGSALSSTEHPSEDLLMVRGEPLVEAGTPFAFSPLTRT